MDEETPALQWTCAQCDQRNAVANIFCTRCSAARPDFGSAETAGDAVTRGGPPGTQPAGYGASLVGLLMVLGCELVAGILWLKFDFSAPRTSDNVYDGFLFFMLLLALWGGSVLGSLVLIVGLVRQYRADALSAKWVVLACAAMLPVAMLAGAIFEGLR